MQHNYECETAILITSILENLESISINSHSNFSNPNKYYWTTSVKTIICMSCEHSKYLQIVKIAKIWPHKIDNTVCNVQKNFNLHCNNFWGLLFICVYYSDKTHKTLHLLCSLMCYYMSVISLHSTQIDTVSRTIIQSKSDARINSRIKAFHNPNE